MLIILIADVAKTDIEPIFSCGKRVPPGRSALTESVQVCFSLAGDQLKGLFTIFLFSVRSHILSSNGVWYSRFCPEGPINASNSNFLVSYFVPRDLDSQRHMGPRLAAQGTLTRSAGDLDSRRHRFGSWSHGTTSRGPLRR